MSMLLLVTVSGTAIQTAMMQPVMQMVLTLLVLAVPMMLMRAGIPA